ncbi:hypothetical protein [Christiangramia forsetii]|uniref:Uncharacterized protein n=2 Tax=Christiangramia forsetii TaxID=411153 RepID=A0M2P2_CHRFK|nr:hypothetical protein [Christiangramia forsetii]GGG44149.1 hypothetical protein GCM10011532_30280 [Christiangramia forsetii]CAL66887.1 hypothetical protein GFO_1922 [Christiangramia forsetii KT0803]
MSNHALLEKHRQLIVHLKERYVLSTNDLKVLEEIHTHTINCVAFTTEGSFDANNGEFYPQEIRGNYKIRIRFQKNESDPENTIYLKLIF